MKINKKIAIFVSSLLCTSSLSADHIASLSTDGTGDFLIAPFYEAKNDVCSEIKVFNTNETSSILAKVAFREQISSQEVDLPIFLTPGDMWSGIVCDDYGTVTLISTDDSNHPDVKDILAKGKNLSKHSKKAGQNDVNFTRGYVEIYPIAQFDEGHNSKVEKSLLVKRWDALSKSNSLDKKLRRSGVDENSLSGLISFQTNDRETASIPMVAFKNAHSAQRVGDAISFGFPAKPSTLLGNDKKMQILKLLQNKSTTFTYDNYGQEQSIYLTFPFGYTQDQERSFTLSVRDLNGNKDKKESIIFSPTATKTKYAINNELAVLPISKLINLTTNPKRFKKGIIQLKEIKNLGDHQLGMGHYASFLPTLVSTMESREKFINSAIKTPVKK